MVEFFLTNWWIYIPIILVLLFLIARNNQRIRYVKQERALKETDPAIRQKKLDELKQKPSKSGLRGIMTYIFPKK